MLKSEGWTFRVTKSPQWIYFLIFAEIFIMGCSEKKLGVPEEKRMKTLKEPVSTRTKAKVIRTIESGFRNFDSLFCLYGILFTFVVYFI